MLKKIAHEVEGSTAVIRELGGDLGGSTPGRREGSSHRSRSEPSHQGVGSTGLRANEVQKYLKGADHPMDGDDLAALAERNGARIGSSGRRGAPAAWTARTGHEEAGLL